MRPRAIDLFAGVGGFSLGLEQAGFDVVAAVEKDPVHAITHQYNFPSAATLCRDLSKVEPEDILQACALDVGELDLLAGGPPCQGFSTMGHRETTDARNSLVFEFLRMVEGLRPHYFVMENVEGLVQGEMGSFVGHLLESFKDAGYSVRFPIQVLNASAFGVPQSRKRVFLVGSRRGFRQPEYPKATGAPAPTVEDAIGDLPPIEDYVRLFSTDMLEPRYGVGSAYALCLRGEAIDPNDFSIPRKRPKLVTGFRRARHTPETRARFRATKQGTVEPVSRFMRLAWDGLAPTLRAGSGSDRGSFSAPRPIHPEKSRCICVREAARLHGFPDWFGFHTTIWHGFRQVGNSVPPPLARAVGSEVLQAIGLTPSRVTIEQELGTAEWLRLPVSQARERLAKPVGSKRGTVIPAPASSEKVQIPA